MFTSSLDFQNCFAGSPGFIFHLGILSHKLCQDENEYDKAYQAIQLGAVVQNIGDLFLFKYAKGIQCSHD